MLISNQLSSIICIQQMPNFQLKCTKFKFRWSSAPDTAGRAYSAPQTPSWWFGAGCPSTRTPRPLLTIRTSILVVQFWKFL